MRQRTAGGDLHGLVQFTELELEVEAFVFVDREHQAVARGCFEPNDTDANAVRTRTEEWHGVEAVLVRRGLARGAGFRLRHRDAGAAQHGGSGVGDAATELCGLSRNLTVAHSNQNRREGERSRQLPRVAPTKAILHWNYRDRAVWWAGQLDARVRRSADRAGAGPTMGQH